MLVCTSFSPAGFDLYGKRCLETFVEHWPCNIVVFHEGKPDFEHPKVEWIALDSVTGFTAYIERIKRLNFGADGNTGHGYDYRWDANKFCRKVFAQDAAFDLDEEVFWLDADSVTHRQVPESFLRGLIEGVPYCYYGRTIYTETGFLGFNTQHPQFGQFRKNYLSQFTEGKIFQEKEGWHDCIAFDVARKGIQGRNLSVDPSVMNVMAQGPTAQYWTHNKGPKRKAKASADAQLYWAMVNDDIIKRSPELEAKFAAGE